MQHDAWFFIGVLVFIFLIWAATGGPTHPLSFAGPTLAQPDELGGGTYLQLPRAPFGIGSGRTVVLPGSSDGSSGGSSVNPLYPGEPAPIYGIAFGTPSPYRDIVRVNHYVSNASSTDPNNEYIEISVAQNAGTPVNITGWKIESQVTFKRGVVPRGTAVPTTGVVNAAEDIVLLPGDRAIIASGESPVGASFRENKCIGYLESFQDFSPSLPQYCPAAPDELKALYGRTYIYDSKCIDYVQTLSRCEVPFDTPKDLTNSCEALLETHLNYNGCVARHRNDPDFNGTTWRVYLGREKYPLWRTRHELIKLFDISGRTVDAFTY